MSVAPPVERLVAEAGYAGAVLGIAASYVALREGFVRNLNHFSFGESYQWGELAGLAFVPIILGVINAVATRGLIAKIGGTHKVSFNELIEIIKTALGLGAVYLLYIRPLLSGTNSSPELLLLFLGVLLEAALAVKLLAWIKIRPYSA